MLGIGSEKNIIQSKFLNSISRIIFGSPSKNKVNVANSSFYNSAVKGAIK